VRELQNVVTRLVLTCGDRVEEKDVRRILGTTSPDGIFSSALLRSRALPDLQLQLEREYLLQLHADSGGDLKAMATRLGITRRALYDRFQRVGLRARDLK
jgi:DNA-binding NtrC family response regulator